MQNAQRDTTNFAIKSHKLLAKRWVQGAFIATQTRQVSALEKADIYWEDHKHQHIVTYAEKGSFSF